MKSPVQRLLLAAALVFATLVVVAPQADAHSGAIPWDCLAHYESSHLGQ